MKIVKIIKISFISLLIVLTSGIILISFTTCKSIKFDTGKDFEYSGLKDVKKEKYIKHRTYISVKDGTKIAVTYLLPKDKKNEKLPTILLYSPYTSSIIVPEMKLYKKIFSKIKLGKWGPDYEKMSLKSINTFIKNGYAIALVDMRGTGSSTGKAGIFDPIFISDGIEVLNWIARQPWSNAKIGMIGQSYLGWSQFALASTHNPYLKCIAPEMIYFNLYEEAVRPGGIFAQKWNKDYSEQTLEIFNKNLWITDLEIPSYPSEPVIDEDGDGKTHDEIPIIKLNSREDITKNPVFADGNPRKNSFYLQLTKNHYDNIWPYEVSKKFHYINDSGMYYDRKIRYSDSSVDRFIYKIKQSHIPVLITGGFFDGFSRGSIRSYINLNQSNPTYLFMAPRFHIPADIAKEYYTFFNYKNNYKDQFLSTQLQFFDKYLKNIDNGFDRKKHIKIYTAFEGWNYYKNWPPDNTHLIRFNLNTFNRLSTEVTKDTTYTYQVDFTHRSAYNHKKTNPMLLVIHNDSVMYRTEIDKKCLIFETKTLNNDITVTGFPLVDFYISSNQPDADIYVYISDVDPEGKAAYVTEGKLRSGWHKLYNNDKSVNNLYDVKPEFPWHSYQKENYDPTPFAYDSIVQIKFEMKPLSWKFQKGHKIRISIAGADDVNYEFNPSLCPNKKKKNCKPTNLYIHTGNSYTSNILLPIVSNL